jgi:TatA/E family protein of Tat protein translocase
MAGLAGHWWILLILAAIALIIFGPSRLPELGASLGRAIREFRKGASEMTDTFKEEFNKPVESSTSGTATVPPPPSTATTPGTTPAAAQGSPPAEPQKS